MNLPAERTKAIFLVSYWDMALDICGWYSYGSCVVLLQRLNVIFFFARRVANVLGRAIAHE